MSKILVTGGLGFIGSHLVESLLEEKNNKITVVDNLCSESSSRDNMRDGVDYIIEDIRNMDSLRLSEDFDIVFHLAALARIQPSFLNPVKYFSIDAFGTAQVLEHARKCKARVVYAGSSSAFGGPMLNPYAFAKYTGEQLCEMYSKVYGLSTVTARFFNVYGLRQPVSGPYATVVGVFENQFSNGEPLTITGNGEQRRDFTHVSDIVSGLITLSQQKWSAPMFQLGTGVNYSINQLASFFSDSTIYIPPRPGEADITLADVEPISKSTSWRAIVNLQEYVTEWKKLSNK